MRTARKPNTHCGFTLIEVLSVVALIALVMAVAITRFERDSSGIAYEEARRFSALVRQLQEESILLGVPMGIEMTPLDNRYSFLRFDGEWIAIEGEATLYARQVDEEVEVESVAVPFREPESDVDESSRVPGIIVEPHGIISPFELRFTGNGETYTVSSLDAGNVSFSKDEN